ncbi:MAG: beta-galactosidase [Candidatus Hydrogenedentes bacterium]|nr:beta-galactosidase [Candidatus Hydrogenedentota bacterium]
MLYYGVGYSPEYWTAEQAQDHPSLMRKAGLNVVRMGEFAWSRFEPESGRYRFDWLDSIIRDLYKKGLATVLNTPTCTPPPWAYAKHRGILRVDRQGHRGHVGTPGYCCKNAPEYQMLADQIVEKMARHFAEFEEVIGWQTDYEVEIPSATRCYCEHCETAFRQWLVTKYGSTDAVNEAWGGAFWSFEFRQWNEIPLPRGRSARCNPGHWLDFARFSSDTQIAFHKRQYELLKSLCPNQFVTHGLRSTLPKNDVYRLAAHLDVVSCDNHSDAQEDPLLASYRHEAARSLKGSFWIMEQACGPTDWARAGSLGESPEPGEMRRRVWQAIANGAEGVLYQRWRACLTGAEQYRQGILDHDGEPRRRYAEVRKTGEELLKVRAYLENARVDARIALILSYEILWSLEHRPGIPNWSYARHCFELYRAVKRRGHACDVVNPDVDLAKYKVVLAPCLTIVDDALVTRLGAFVKGGGTLLLTPRAGACTPANAMTHRTRPGLLTDLVGATVEDVRAYHRGQTQEITFARGGLIAQTCTVGQWIEMLKCTSAEAVAEYRTEPFAGKPAIVRREHGLGEVHYLGVYLPTESLEKFLSYLLPEYPVKSIPDGVEITQRKGDAGRIVFIINHRAERQTLELPGKMQDLLTEEIVGPQVKVASHGVLILRV